MRNNFYEGMHVFYKGELCKIEFVKPFDATLILKRLDIEKDDENIHTVAYMENVEVPDENLIGLLYNDSN